MATQITGGRSAGGRGSIKGGFKGQSKLPPVKIGHTPKKQNVKKQAELKRDMRLGSFAGKQGHKGPHILGTDFNYDGPSGKTTMLIRTRSGH